MDAQEVFDQYSTQIEKKEDKYFLHLYENSYEITDLLHPGKTIYVQGKGNGIIHYAKITLDPDGSISSSISTEPEIEADSYQNSNKKARSLAERLFDKTRQDQIELLGVTHRKIMTRFRQ